MNTNYDTPEQEEAARKLRKILWLAEQQRQRDLAYGETQLWYMRQIRLNVLRRFKTLYWVTWGAIGIWTVMVLWLLYEMYVRKHGPF